MHSTFDLALNLIVTMSGGVNVYDITKYQSYPTQLLESFFDNADILEKFKLKKDIKYSSQSSHVY